MYTRYFQKYRLIFFFAILSFGLATPIAGKAQKPLVKIHGWITDASTRVPIGYVNVYNPILKKGTITNPEGFFEIEIIPGEDSLLFSCVGYRKKVISHLDHSKPLSVKLEASVQLLNEVEIKEPDYSYLCQLLADASRKKVTVQHTARSYYSLKSYIDTTQVELVESFYNAEIRGYDLNSLEMKTGRFALKQFDDWIFVSQNTSLAILKQNLTDSKGLFPQNPLEFSAKKMWKLFYFDLEKRYLDDNQDSVYVIWFAPKDKSGKYFNGRVWLDPERKLLYKISFECVGCGIHPFQPLAKTDSLLNVNLQITRTFNLEGNEVLPNHTDFTYQFDYVSRRIVPEGSLYNRAKRYHISATALLYPYNYVKPFSIPRFTFTDEHIRDYHKINAMPYNSFFWNFNDEYRMNDVSGANQLFFQTHESISNTNIFNKDESVLGNTFYESPYVYWSLKRITIREVTSDTLKKPTDLANNPKVNADLYHLSAKIFMDVNTFRDSTHVLTATIFDPYDTYYLLPSDHKTLCFINIYFDLFEIRRRQFMDEISHQKLDEEAIQSAYNRMMSELSEQSALYLKEVSRGENLIPLKKWNQLVVSKLEIDNMQLFLHDNGE
jgi:hypothetical protein